MSRRFKTGKKNRITYIYRPAKGPKIVITPNENGVNATDIELLHAMDDAEMDERRRHEYRVTAHFDAYHDGEDEDAGDRNPYLTDNSYNPEQVLMEEIGEAEHLNALNKLAKAMEHLLPQQRMLFKKRYVDGRSNSDIADEEGVSEAAIRNRLKKMHQRLKKYFL